MEFELGKFEITSKLGFNKLDKYYSFLEEKSYLSEEEFRGNFTKFIEDLFSCFELNNSLDGFDIVYDKIEESKKGRKYLKTFLKEANKYIDAYNSCLKQLGSKIRMNRITEKCQEVLGRTELQLGETQKQLIDTRTQLTDTRIELTNTQTQLTNTQTRLEKTEKNWTNARKNWTNARKNWSNAKKDLKNLKTEVAILKKIIDELTNQ